MTGTGWHDAIRERMREHEREREQVVVAETHASADEVAAEAPDWKQRLRQRLVEHEGERARERAQDPEGRPLPAFSNRFRMLRELGRGGMGAVIEAEDEQLGRRVAVKVLLESASASPLALERFAFEARAAARLRHPGIVAVHEVGEQRGQRFLVMDLIEGRSLAALLKEQGPLEPREAAGIAKAVAEALAHAHAHAILHRDVKPGNVLITPAGQPLLTDFGLAKDVDADAEVTASGQAMGTPAYMPPEQAQGQRERIDRRADVYALGATLYHMLTGRPPFLGGSAVSLLRQVVDDEPPAPSKVGDQAIDRDLETIVIRCLEKDPARRYDSASALAEDLGRFLAHEPIAARRATWLERLGKWRRRNRAVAATLGGSGLLLLAVVVVGTAVFLQRLRRERDLARAAASQARESLDLFVFEVREQLQDLPSRQARAARSRLLALALDRQLRLQALEAQAGLPTTSLREPEAYLQIGDLALDGGQIEVALDAFTRAGEAARELAAQDPEPSHVRSRALALLRMSRTLRELGRPEEAPALVEEALALLAALPPQVGVASAICSVHIERGDLLTLQNEFAPALEAYEQALAIARQMVEQVGEDSEAVRALAVALDRTGETSRIRGDLARARESLEEGLEVSRRLGELEPGKRSRRDIYVACTRVGDLRLATGDHAAATAAFGEALELARGAHQADPDNAQTARDLAFCLQQVGICLGHVGRHADAGERYAEALGVLRGLHRRDPANLGPRRRLARLLDHMGAHAREAGELQQAEAYYRESLSISEELTDAESGLSRRDVAVSWLNVGDVERQQGLREQAEASYRRALALQLQLVEETEGRVARDDLANLRSRLGRLLLTRGEPEEGLRLLEAALAEHRALYAERPDDAEVRGHLAVTLEERGRVALARSQLEEALVYAREACEHHAALDGRSAVVARRHGQALELEAMALRGLDRLEEARDAAGRSVDRLRRAAQLSGARSDARELGVGLAALALLHEDPAVRLALLEDVVAIHRDLVAQDPSHAGRVSDLATSLSRLADHHLATGAAEASQDCLEQALATLRAAAEAQPSSESLQEDLGLFLQRLGQVQQGRGGGEAAEASYREAIACARPLGLDSSRGRDALARALLSLGSLRFAAEDLDGAREAWTEGLVVCRARLARDPDSLTVRRDLSIALLKLYNVRRVEQDLEGARALLTEAVANHRVLVERASQYAPELAQFERLLAAHPPQPPGAD